MSRTSNRGPRADIALLRKLKADPNFSPSSLLGAGSDILEKANKLKGFVTEQRGKLGASAAKTEWLLAYQQLQTDQDDAERELTSSLQQIADQPSTGAGGSSGSGNEVSEAAAAALAVLGAQGEAVRSERQRLRSQVQGVSSVHRSFRAYGAPAQFRDEARAHQGEMSALRGELDSALEQLTKETATLTSELRNVWPSALAGAGAPGPGGEAGEGGGGGELQLGPGSGAAEEWRAELERMMARYPLASADIKDRIREVYGALQEKYLERLETWRLEVERAAAALTAGSTYGTGAGTSAPASRRPSQPSSGLSLGVGRAAGLAGRVGSGGPSAAPTAGSPGPGRGRVLQPVVTPKRPSLSGRGAGGAAGGSGGGTPPPGFFKTALPHTMETGVGPGGGDDEGLLPGGSRRPSATGGGEAGAAWLLSGYGGWSAEEHSAFLRHRERLLKEGGQGAKSGGGREALMARIARLLPGGRSACELLAHDDWSTAARLAARKRRDLAEGWERERRQFLEDSGAFLQESEALFLVQAEEAADRLVTELLRERAQEELQELRVERAREEEVAAAEAAARGAAEAEARLAEAARERAERAVKRDMVAAYRAELERQAAEAAAEAEAAAAAAAAEAEVQAEHNRERVEWRQNEFLAKQEVAKERQEALAAEAAAREARLARLRALVAPEVAADPARLLAATAASAAAEQRAEGAFQPVNGYTVDQVVRDQRFKVMEALSALGLHETDYGRRVIAAARPAKAPRPDNFTSEQREAMTHR